MKGFTFNAIKDTRYKIQIAGTGALK